MKSTKNSFAENRIIYQQGAPEAPVGPESQQDVPIENADDALKQEQEGTTSLVGKVRSFLRSQVSRSQERQSPEVEEAEKTLEATAREAEALAETDPSEPSGEEVSAFEGGLNERVGGETEAIRYRSHPHPRSLKDITREQAQGLVEFLKNQGTNGTMLLTLTKEDKLKEVMPILKEFQGKLHLGINNIDADLANSLKESQCSEIHFTNNLENITPEAAKILMEIGERIRASSSVNDEIRIASEQTEPTRERYTAASLARMRGTITEEQAGHLLEDFKGESLSLVRLNEKGINRVANILKNHEGDLRFALRSVGKETINSLNGFQGELYLDNVRELDEATASALATSTFSKVSLNSLNPRGRNFDRVASVLARIDKNKLVVPNNVEERIASKRIEEGEERVA